MYGIVNYFRGYVRVKVIGAEPERCLNALTEGNIPFWDILREDDLHYSFCIYKGNLPTAEALTIRAYCSLEIEQRAGFLYDFRGVLRRPALLVGMLIAVVATILLQNVVWTIEVDGNSQVHEKEILRALETLDIKVGAWGASIDSQQTKHQMLNLIPELSWLAVNRSGGCLQVLVTERSSPRSERPEYDVANVIAARDGVLTEVSVLEGMKLCAVGNTVSKGQLLVSGYEDYGLCVRAVCADAEIYAATWHTGTVLTPSQTYVKRYTGEEWTQKNLIVGRNRINLYGNSRISTGNCDKMIDIKVLALPKGHDFPVTLETITYREYELVATDVDQTQSRELLLKAWERMTRDAMIAGVIKETSSQVVHSGGVYALHASSTCEEMIARIVPAEELYKGETYE